MIPHGLYHSPLQIPTNDTPQPPENPDGAPQYPIFLSGIHCRFLHSKKRRGMLRQRSWQSPCIHRTAHRSRGIYDGITSNFAAFAASGILGGDVGITMNGRFVSGCGEPRDTEHPSTKMQQPRPPRVRLISAVTLRDRQRLVQLPRLGASKRPPFHFAMDGVLSVWH
ncbi:hypothetical protein FA95DRAFT_1095911 [Auriscalpium vulgare]|uniref:Uncharacterized protein n=1 Tax=Auriscalpium vulgare TaxID=40419 RepID=A0ACB8RXJ9_9AGAM|nr:hypothetical protein FA95DRAFT_1095911 [Auriscalpium vulgare]